MGCVFHLGLSQRFEIPLAFIVQGVGAIFILLNFLLGTRPGPSTVLNMLSVGPIMQFFLNVVPGPEALVARWAVVAAGLFIGGLGTGLYVSADLGSGPRDTMMIGLTRRFNVLISLIKNGMDLTVAVSGWLFGGPLGLETVVVTVLSGPATQLGIFLTAQLAQVKGFSSFVRPVVLKNPA